MVKILCFGNDFNRYFCTPDRLKQAICSETSICIEKLDIIQMFIKFCCAACLQDFSNIK